MSSALSQSLQRTSLDDKSGDELTPPLPALPATRTRRLSTGAASSATATSHFFRLPVEIRRSILVYAFGARTVHFDLRLLHPLKQPKPESDEPSRRCYLITDQDRMRERDTSQPRQWEWWSTVCRRRGKRWLWDNPPEASPCRFKSSNQDSCRDELIHGTPCRYWRKSRKKYPIRIMGWLLSCRAAYVEGVDALYGTCSFHIEGSYLFRHLQEVLLPERVSMITAVELVWDLNLWDASETGAPALSAEGVASRQPPDEPGMEGYASLVESIPDMLPNLRYLYISLQGSLMPPAALPDGLNPFEMLLQPVDNLVRKMNLRECRIALPSKVFRWFYLTSPYALEHQSGYLMEEAIQRHLPALGDSEPRTYWLVHGQMNLSTGELYGFHVRYARPFSMRGICW